MYIVACFSCTLSLFPSFYPSLYPTVLSPSLFSRSLSLLPSLSVEVPSLTIFITQSSDELHDANENLVGLIKSNAGELLGEFLGAVLVLVAVEERAG